MKKIILAAAIIFTTGILAIVKRDGSNNMPVANIARISIPNYKNVLGTAD